MAERATDWDRVRSVFERALELPPDEVDSFLEAACADDMELRREVESLITADREAPEFLDRPGFVVPGAQPDPAPSLEGTRVGAWRVLHEIGRGGMSVVHLGERADGRFERRVAVKVLQSDARLARLADRLREERRILGTLDHRGIVRILDGGVLDDGRPYLVMDHIDGERIDAWCDHHRLTVEERLRLFTQVLDAVAYAHRSLVVHRDLKPDNILVTDAGEVRLLDFGIAKLLDPEEAAAGTPTRTGLRALTPEYAAPEQIRGDPITTVADVYALGVLLFHLLTGQRPYPPEASTPWEVEQAVLTSEPDRPSQAVRRTQRTGFDAVTVDPATIAAARRTDPDRLHVTLDGDLDAIVLKALRKEPAERYASADAFREDIERYLASLPVVARRGSRAYHVRKFVRRHRGAVIGATAAVLLVLSSTVAIARSRVVAQRALVQAERDARTAREVTDFLIGVFGGADPWNTRGDTVSARTILEQGRERITRELVDQPVVRASLLSAIGEVYAGLGLLTTADTLVSEAIRLRVEDAAAPADLELAGMYQALAGIQSEEDHFAEAIANFDRALAIRNARADPDSAMRAAVLMKYAFALAENGQADSALALAASALAIDSARADTISEGHLDRLVAYATVLRSAERLEQASAVYADVLPRIARQMGTDHPRHAEALNNAAFMLTRQGRPAEAVPLYRQALDIVRRTLGPDHDRVRTFRHNLASALMYVGESDEALRLWEENLALQRSLWGEESWQVGGMHETLGSALLSLGRHAGAEDEFRSAVASYQASLGVDHSWSIVGETWLILAMTMRGDPRGPSLLDRAITRLATADIDFTTRADIERIAGYLDGIGMTDRAARFRALLQ